MDRILVALPLRCNFAISVPNIHRLQRAGQQMKEGRGGRQDVHRVACALPWQRHEEWCWNRGEVSDPAALSLPRFHFKENFAAINIS